MNKTLVKKIVYILVLISFIIHLAFRVFEYRERYLVRYDFEYWKNRYLSSQWVDPESTNPIGDDGLYSYAAWEYINGADPSLINPEMPFLGKYLLGATILIFKNENIFALITGLFVILIYYLFNRLIFKNNFLAAIPVILFSFERLFYEQLRAPFFDTLQLLSLFLILISFLKGKYLLTSIFIGMFAISKFPFMVILPIITLFFYLVFYESRKKMFSFLFNLPVAVFVYLLSYIQFFLLGNTLYRFFSVQKYIFNFYQSGATSPFFGTVIPLIAYGEWHTHFQSKIKIHEWNLLWPISSFLTILTLLFRKLFDKGITLNLIWVVLYLLFLCFTPVFPRYLLLLLPFLYNLAVWVILKGINGRFFSRYLSF